MALLAFWKSNPNEVLQLHVRQIISNAGDGQIRDGSDSSAEIRSFLQMVPASNIIQYVEECLDEKIPEGGLFLQDLVNEIGRRLDFEVEPGLYRGRRGQSGHDGIWRSDDGPPIIIEVKTTDYVALSLDKIATYKKLMINQGVVNDNASILIIVGREDTGVLEAQIRGSRYAWDARVISVDRLCSLLKIREKTDQDTTIRQIRELLRPFEYTRIDRIIDIIFQTAEDVAEDASISENESGYAEAKDVDPRTQLRTPRETLEACREAAVHAFANKNRIIVQRARRTFFMTGDRQWKLCVTVSKRYPREAQPYWYAFHPEWRNFLQDAPHSYLIIACIDRSDAFAIPLIELDHILPSLYQTERPNGKSYWHLALTPIEKDALAIRLADGKRPFDISAFRFSLG